MTTHVDCAAILDGYVTCALWASTGDDEQPLDDWATPEDVVPGAIAEMRSDLAQFVWFNRADVRSWVEAPSAEQVGHDFWLTRNGHGTGFWDQFYNHPLSAIGDRLAAAARVWGESCLYVGDDGQVYVS